MGVVFKYLVAIVIVFFIGYFLIKSFKSLIDAIRARIEAKKSPKQVSDEKPAENVDTDDRKGGASI